MTKAIITASMALLMAGAISAGAAEAKENWDKHCTKCHGADGKGQTTMGKKMSLKDYTDAKVQEGMKDDEIAKAIKEGKKPKMKGYGDVLSDDEIKALVKQVRSFKK